MRFTPKIIPLAGAIALALSGSAYAEEQVIKIGHSGPLTGSKRLQVKTMKTGCVWRSRN